MKRTMSKSLAQIVAFLLVPCLVADPAMASALTQNEAVRPGRDERPPEHVLYVQEAVVPPLAQFEHLNTPNTHIAAMVAHRESALLNLGVSADPQPRELMEALVDSDTLLINDIRAELDIKRNLRSHLALLKSHGFDYLAVEILPANLQKELNRWDTSDPAAIREYLNLKIMSREGSSIPDAYMELFAEAKAQGIKLIALDDDINYAYEIPTYWMDKIKKAIGQNNSSKVIILAAERYFSGNYAHGVPLTLVLKQRDRSYSVVQLSSTLEKPKSPPANGVLEFKALTENERDAYSTLQVLAHDRWAMGDRENRAKSYSKVIDQLIEKVKPSRFVGICQLIFDQHLMSIQNLAKPYDLPPLVGPL